MKIGIASGHSHNTHIPQRLFEWERCAEAETVLVQLLSSAGHDVVQPAGELHELENNPALRAKNPVYRRKSRFPNPETLAVRRSTHAGVKCGRGSIPSSVQTRSDGTWSASGFQPGTTYRAWPRRSGWRFSPASTTFSILSRRALKGASFTSPR